MNSLSLDNPERHSERTSGNSFGMPTGEVPEYNNSSVTMTEEMKLDLKNLLRSSSVDPVKFFCVRSTITKVPHHI